VGGQPGHDGDRRGNPDFCPPNQHVKKSTSTPEDEIISDINPNRDANDVVAADPSAVAAACRAGEELERRKLAGSATRSASAAAFAFEAEVLGGGGRRKFQTSSENSIGTSGGITYK
jgi:hypothetical protein